MESVQATKQRFGIIGDDPKLNRAIEKAIQVSPTDISVLVTGESGVGKESIPKIINFFTGHKTKAVHGESYDRATRFKERKRFMNEWSDYLERLQKETAQESARKELRLV